MITGKFKNVTFSFLILFGLSQICLTDHAFIFHFKFFELLFQLISLILHVLFHFGNFFHHFIVLFFQNFIFFAKMNIFGRHLRLKSLNLFFKALSDWCVRTPLLFKLLQPHGLLFSFEFSFVKLFLDFLKILKSFISLSLQLRNLPVVELFLILLVFVFILNFLAFSFPFFNFFFEIDTLFFAVYLKFLALGFFLLNFFFKFFNKATTKESPSNLMLNRLKVRKFPIEEGTHWVLFSDEIKDHENIESNKSVPETFTIESSNDGSNNDVNFFVRINASILHSLV